MSTLVTARQLALAGRLECTDLDLEAGELVCLIGPNGSGKTSLLHALARIGAPLGQVTVGGVDPAREPPSRRGRLLSYLAASRDIAWPLIARDLVALGLPEGVPESRIDAMLDLFDLEAFANRRVDHLSTGERSRLLIARALVSDAKLLLLDEPTANLDPLWQLRLMDHLRALVAGSRRSALVAVHDLDIARRYADRLLIMDRGRIEADGPPDVLLLGPHIERVFGIVASQEGWRPLAR
jgi:iron complex transport system ATP-binding protein